MVKKLYISIDMEGLSGVVVGDHVSRTGKDYEWARKEMVREVSAVIDTAFKNNVEYILVNDSHGSMINLYIDQLPEGNIEIITGSLKPLSMMEGITSNFDACFFIGYHARKGTRAAVLDHTIFGRAYHKIIINGRETSEFYLNALVAGHFKVPLALLAGDDKIVDEARSLIPNIETVITKYSITRYAARHVHPKVVEKILREATRRALENVDSGKVKPLTTNTPIKLELVFTSTALADACENIPTALRKNAFTLEFTVENIIEAYKVIKTASLVSSAILK